MTFINYMKNKIVSMIVLAVAIVLYRMLPDSLPFAELLYTGINVLSIIIAAPFIRLLVFQEVAEYAESGQLDEDLGRPQFTPALIHYWFATAISYGACIACIATISK
jgi:Na+/proline symporter